MNLVSYIIVIIISISLYFWIGFNIFNNYKNENTNALYFYIIYGIFFIILINILCLLNFYSKIINKTGYPGEIGDIGDKGNRGENGTCTVNCNKNKCKDKFIDVINEKYKELYKTDKTIIKEIKSKDLDKNKKQLLENIKSLKTKIEDFKLKKNPLNEIIDTNKLYKQIVNDIIDNTIEDKIKNITYSRKDYNYVLNIKKELEKIDRIIKDIEFEIKQLDDRFKKIDIDSIIDRKLINNLLSEIVINLCNSQQYQKAIEIKKPKEVDAYISDFLKIMVETIYNNLENKNSFFNSSYANDKNTKFKQNPFKLLEKYDVYYWGVERIFKPLKININNTLEDNFLPTEHKPTLHFLNTNNVEWIYDDSTGHKDPKISFFRPGNLIKYKKEKYYPIGNIISNEKNIKTSDIFTNKFHIRDNEKLNEKSKKKLYERSWDLKNDSGEVNIPKKETIMVTGDISTPIDLIKVSDNIGSQERNNISIWRLKCKEGYNSLSDYAILGHTKPDLDKLTIKCLPEKCLIDNNDIDIKKNYYDGSFGKIYYSKDKDDNNFNIDANQKNSYNTFRHSKDYENNKLKKINEDCLKTTKRSISELTDNKLGLGWIGRPLREPKYSIFSFLVQFPHGIIANKATNFKYYIIHTELYNNRNKPQQNKFKTDAKNLYYVLTLNPKDNTYNQCLSVNKNKIIRTNIRNEEQCYWVLDKVNRDNYDEIRLISYQSYKNNKSDKTKNKFLVHNRRKDLRRDIVRQRVFEQLKLEQNVTDKDLITFVNIKSTFGTNISTGFEETKYRKNNKNNNYYNLATKVTNTDKNTQNNKHTQKTFKKRGIAN
jgi:hypothetical protein